MDIINLIASLISGAIGGNMVGGALNDQSLDHPEIRYSASSAVGLLA